MENININQILKAGETNGLQWVILSHPAGHRCGYVKLPKGFPIEFDLDVHGGITYNNGGWIGFDCAHGCDSPDPELLNEQYEFMRDMIRPEAIKSTNYVETECRVLCSQIAKIMGK